MNNLKSVEFLKLIVIPLSIYTISCNSNSGIVKENNLNETTTTIPLRPNIIEKTPSEIEKTTFQVAYDLWYNNKPKEGIDKFLKFIKTYPESSLSDDAQRMIGTAYSNMENYNKAVEEFEKVKIIYPESNSTPLVLYDLAHLYFFNLNDFEKAKYYYEEFIASATIENEKFRDFAIDQLNNWEENTKRFTGYEEQSKQLKKDRQAETPKKYLEILNENWYKGGFGVIGIHSFSIQNNSDISFKDVVIMIEYSSESGTLLARNLRTVYKIIPSKQTIKIDELNTGVIPPDALSSKIEIITAIGIK
jgi:tetratricopeptide (TPR) repeat protein